MKDIDSNRNTDIVNAHIAQALAREYTDLFYVNMETGEFTEFLTGSRRGVLSAVRHGSGFFESCRREALLYVHEDDQAAFIKAMHRDFLADAVREQQTFELVYRRIKNENTFYVQMNVSRMEDDPRFIVIAVRDINELMLKRLASEKIEEEQLIYARLHALNGNYICVYVVDPATNAYREFTATDDYAQSFAQAKEGSDFFETVRKVSGEFNHPQDQKRFLKSVTKENILRQIKRRGLYTLDYRLMKDGNPLHVQLKAATVNEKDGMRLIVGLINTEAQYLQDESYQKLEAQNAIYDQITASLAEQYDTLYFIDIETSTYIEISATDEYKKLNVPATGDDFFAESRRSIRKYVHPEDQKKALRVHYKEVMLENLKNRHSFSIAYRLVTDGEVHHIRHTEIPAKDGKHILVCIKNIDAEVQAQLAYQADQRRSNTFTQIAERLADHYDFIYYIEVGTSRYTELAAKKRSGELKVQDEGEDFFATARINADRLIYSEDRERIKLFLDRDRLISRLENDSQVSEDYRMVIDMGKTQFTRMSVTYSSDHSHFIICVENRDKDVRKEQEHIEALRMANTLARRDELTHTKNKTAYHEKEEELNRLIKEGHEPFGIVVCDINNLKVINDTEGHKAGDEYIKASCTMICRIFAHSPVFRIGGDEFVVILTNQEYKDRQNLISRLRRQVEENLRIGEGPIVASGIAVYSPEEDHSADDVFKRADSQMYEDKAHLKSLKLLQESRSMKEKAMVRLITDERRTMLDTLYRSFKIVAEGTYVFLCDMKYDFSRWSKIAVDTFGLPSQYMYGAGDIWENRIHPEDRAAYRAGINEIFAGDASGHDMQYRAKRVDGTYDVCTCRGTVIRDSAGEPDYFVGTIRNHGIQGHIDTLTGLRNQYGFFEDLDGCILRRAEISVVLLGISRFSEINEMYGYHFGNRVLQLFARKALETVGNTGHLYRIDGTRFAVISNTLTIGEIREIYNSFRTYFHEDFTVDSHKILLDLQCGAVRVDDFNVDSETVYGGLNFAYTESKLRQQGDLVEFRNAFGGETYRRLEILHRIRASIKHGYEGFYLLFQPVVGTDEQEIGAEALLRWKSDPYEAVPPDRFIPILESDPLFPELGEWIITEALLAAKQVLLKNPKFVINVNLSYTQLEKPDFVDMVERILQNLDYPPEHLCFELTERCRLLDLELLNNTLVRLKSLGILIALDDFGTGFSSVGILKEIPIDIIKIDRSFVQKIEKDETDRKIMRAISNLASIFDAKVCAEGIETKGTAEILKSCRVESFQGFYYSEPLPLQQFLEWSPAR